MSEKTRTNSGSAPRYSLVLLAALIAVFPLLLRPLWEARIAFKLGDQLLQSGETLEAARKYSAALKWSFPGNRFSRSAESALNGLIDRAKRTEKAAYLQLLREGLMTSRSGLNWRIGENRAKKLQRIDTKLSELHANQRPKVREVTYTGNQFGLQFVTFCLFLGWISCIGFLIWRGTDAMGGFLPSAPGWAAATVILYAAWIFGLWNA